MTNIRKSVPNCLGDETVSDDASSPDHDSVSEESEINREISDSLKTIPEDHATDYNLEFTNSSFGSPMVNADLPRDQILPTAAISKDATVAVQGPAAAPQVPELQIKKKKERKNQPTRYLKNGLQDIGRIQNQNSRKFLIPRLTFSRLVRTILWQCSDDGMRITRTALEALQESSEIYLLQQMQDAYTLTLHRGRLTLSVKDMELLRFIRGRN